VTSTLTPTTARPGSGLRILQGKPPTSTRGHAATGAIEVLIAHGQQLMRAGLRAMLDAEDGLTAVGEAASGEETVALAGRLRPDIVLMDAELAGLDCVEATRRISAEADVAVMLLTASESDDRIFAALRSGAGGLVLKDVAPDELVRAVKALTRGDAQLSPSLTRRLLSELAARPEPSAPKSALLEELTAREREVLELVALGFGNNEIAERLRVSRTTAKTHVSRVMLKLGARTRARLVVFGYETGLVVPRTDVAARPPLSLASSHTVTV
jgi:DNA-binding NarL/FixJ family response regulator